MNIHAFVQCCVLLCVIVRCLVCVCVCVCVDFVIVIFSLPEMMNRVEYIKSVGLFEFLVLLEA